MIDARVPKRPVNSGSRGIRELKGLSLMLITRVSLLGVGVEFFRLLQELLVVGNDPTTSFLECKGA